MTESAPFTELPKAYTPRDVEGDIYEADPQLCGWVGGPKVAHHRIQRAQA